jgi:glycosyltransferase
MHFSSEEPLVSIITPVYNGAEYLDDLIQSVLNQDYKNIEHIVIDDGSTDGGKTLGVLKKYTHLKLISRENKGQYESQNDGLALANGELVSIISADDMYVLPSAISSVIEYRNSHPNVDCIYGKTLLMDEGGVDSLFQSSIGRNYPLWLLRYKLFILHCSLFVSRRALLKYKIFFDVSFKYSGDWDWIYRLYKNGLKFGYLDDNLSKVRIHRGQTTRIVGEFKMIQEDRVFCSKHSVSFAAYIVFRKYFMIRSMILKVIGTLFNDGLKGVYGLAKRWITRHLPAKM